VTVLLALAGFYAAMMLVRYGRRGAIVLAPWLVSSRPGRAGTPPTPAQQAAARALAPLGFRPLGSRVEEGPLGGLGLRSEAWSDGAFTFADLFEQGPRAGEPARVQLLTAFPDGAAVLTADHERAPRSGPRGRLGGHPGATPARLLELHRDAVTGEGGRHGAPLPARDLAGRDAAARAWYRGLGGEEMRRRLAPFLLNTIVAAAILAFCLTSLVRARSAP
jgi:hypothetical protein